TLVQYAAVQDAQGNPVKDANGRFTKGALVAYTVMEKRAGWGAEYADNVRNGEWEYQAFTKDKTVNDKANLTACFNCHKPLDKQDSVYSYDKLKAAAKWVGARSRSRRAARREALARRHARAPHPTRRACSILRPLRRRRQKARPRLNPTAGSDVLKEVLP